MLVVMIVALVAVAVLQPIVAAWAIARTPASRDHRPCARLRIPARLDVAGNEVSEGRAASSLMDRRRWRRSGRRSSS